MLPNAVSIGPSSAIDVVLSGIRLAAHDTNLYTFERPNGDLLPPVDPGAHIELVLPNGLERQYSLIFAEQSPRAYTVGIKRDNTGRGGSRWIHDHLRVGNIIAIHAPRNNFPLTEHAAQTVFFAGGIGITPIYCMINRLQQIGREFTLYYSCRSRTDAPFLRELSCMPNAHLHFDDEAGGKFLPIAELVKACPMSAHLYCCGPAPMLTAFEAAAGDRPPGQVHVEYFSKKQEASVEGDYVVFLAKSQCEINVPPGKTILQALRDNGLEPRCSCEEGICGSCETAVISGIPDHRDAILTDNERRTNKTMMICVSGSKSARLVLDL